MSGRDGDIQKSDSVPSVKSVPAKGDPPEGACSPHSGALNKTGLPFLPVSPREASSARQQSPGACGGRGTRAGAAPPEAEPGGGSESATAAGVFQPGLHEGAAAEEGGTG